MGHIHIHSPPIDQIAIVRLDCPTCAKSRFMVRFFQEWYGSTLTCLKCGERWQSGEMCPRPFYRAWRKDSVRQVKETYRRWRKVLTASQQSPKHDHADSR
jgi:hypothetical protein